MKISEGLRENDLKDLVTPFLSIDEYESKISGLDEIIVVGFFVDDKEPAQELSRFVDRSIEDILDTDVSPAPNESGYYMMFLEMHRNEKFFETLSNVLDEVSHITGITEWTFKAYKNDEILDFTEENIRRTVRTTEMTHESFVLKSFFDDASINIVNIFESYVQLNNYYFKIIDLNPKPKLLVESSLSLSDASLSRRIDNMLGIHYNSLVTGDTVQIKNNLINKIITVSI